MVYQVLEKLVKAKMSFPLWVIWKGLLDTLNLGKIHQRKLIFVIKSMAFSYKETFAGVIRLKGQHMVGLHYTICGKIKHCNTSTSPHVRVYKEVN